MHCSLWWVHHSILDPPWSRLDGAQTPPLNSLDWWWKLMVQCMQPIWRDGGLCRVILLDAGSESLRVEMTAWVVELASILIWMSSWFSLLPTLFRLRRIGLAGCARHTSQASLKITLWKKRKKSIKYHLLVIASIMQPAVHNLRFTATRIAPRKPGWYFMSKRTQVDTDARYAWRKERQSKSQ